MYADSDSCCRAISELAFLEHAEFTPAADTANLTLPAAHLNEESGFQILSLDFRCVLRLMSTPLYYRKDYRMAVSAL